MSHLDEQIAEALTHGPDTLTYILAQEVTRLRKVTAAESLPILREWERTAKAVRKQVRAITAKTSPIRVELESPLLDAIWAMDSAHSESVEIRISGASFGWLEWYAVENDFGRKAMEAGPSASMRPIRTLRDLAWLLEVAA